MRPEIKSQLPALADGHFWSVGRSGVKIMRDQTEYGEWSEPQQAPEWAIRDVEKNPEAIGNHYQKYWDSNHVEVEGLVLRPRGFSREAVFGYRTRTKPGSKHVAGGLAEYRIDLSNVLSVVNEVYANWISRTTDMDGLYGDYR